MGFVGFTANSDLSFWTGARWQQSSLAAGGIAVRSQPALFSQQAREAGLTSLQ